MYNPDSFSPKVKIIFASVTYSSNLEQCDRQKYLVTTIITDNGDVLETIDGC